MCTGVRFSDDKGNMFFGRNLDWSNGYGEKVTITPREFSYNSPFLGEMHSKEGAIIGMAIIEEGIPLYFDCCNEAGLGVAGLNFPHYAKYEKDAVEGKTNIAAWEFPLYIVMNFSSVEDVKAALPEMAIVSKPINEKYPVSELHFMIADGKQSIVVEYTERGMEIFDNDVDILTNQPGYNWHQENLRNYMNLYPRMPKEVKWNKATMKPFGSGALMRGLPGDYTSTSRFVRAAYLNTHYPVKTTEEENVSRLFHTLASVAMIDGAGEMAGGRSEITIYVGGYSAASKTYYYSLYEDLALTAVSLEDYNLDSKELLQV